MLGFESCFDTDFYSAIFVGYELALDPYANPARGMITNSVWRTPTRLSRT